jgi:hypothetical protein
MEDLATNDLDTILNILPYDYVRERMIIALVDKNEQCNVYSPNIINIKTYQELSRFLNKPFVVNKCSAEDFNEMLTNHLVLKIPLIRYQRNYPMTLILNLLQEILLQLKIY